MKGYYCEYKLKYFSNVIVDVFQTWEHFDIVVKFTVFQTTTKHNTYFCHLTIILFSSTSSYCTGLFIFLFFPYSLIIEHFPWNLRPLFTSLWIRTKKQNFKSVAFILTSFLVKSVLCMKYDIKSGMLYSMLLSVAFGSCYIIGN